MLRILTQRPAVVSIGALVLQQLMVASSTVWVSRLGRDVATNRPFTLDLFLFLASLGLTYFPDMLSAIALARWTQAAHAAFISAFVDAHATAETQWGSSRVRSAREPYLTTEGASTIESTTHYFHDLVGTGLNVVFNIIALVVVIDPLLLLGYGVGLALTALCLVYAKKTVEERAALAQDTRVRLGSVLLTGWDNILLRNQYNLGLWVARMRDRFHRSADAQVGAARANQGAILVASWAGMIPVFAVLIYLFRPGHSDPGSLAAGIVTLPRQMIVLNHLLVIVGLVTHWTAIRAQWRGLLAALSPPPREDLGARIAWTEISIRRDGQWHRFAHLDECLAELRAVAAGRVTISGPNGSGKSTLLLLLKEAFGARAIYLPAQSALYFASDETPASTGERLALRLRELAAHPAGHRDAVDVFLLDEWDANLDNLNREMSSAVLNELSDRAVVVEVRHHADQAVAPMRPIQR